MAKCKKSGCTVTSPRRINQNGYCDKHSSPQKETSPPPADTSDSRLDRLESENVSLKQNLKLAFHHIKVLYTTLNDVMSAVNCTNYSNDD